MQQRQGEYKLGKIQCHGNIQQAKFYGAVEG
jgi:hypothetical protein